MKLASTRVRAIAPESGVGRMILRLALGSTMVVHGVRHLRTLEGTASWFESIGFREPRLQAQTSAVVEIGAGAAICAGAATPLSASAVVGTMTVAYQSVHRQNGYFITAEGWEYVGFITAAAVALSALGPGSFSADRIVGLDDVGTPTKRALLTLALGVGGAAAQLRLFWTKPAE